jgi:hypothetical protein
MAENAPVANRLKMFTDYWRLLKAEFERIGPSFKTSTPDRDEIFSSFVELPREAGISPKTDPAEAYLKGFVAHRSLMLQLIRKVDVAHAEAQRVLPTDKDDGAFPRREVLQLDDAIYDFRLGVVGPDSTGVARRYFEDVDDQLEDLKRKLAETLADQKRNGDELSKCVEGAIKATENASSVLEGIARTSAAAEQLAASQARARSGKPRVRKSSTAARKPPNKGKNSK